jgi:hypothetical protein
VAVCIFSLELKDPLWLSAIADTCDRLPTDTHSATSTVMTLTVRAGVLTCDREDDLFSSLRIRFEITLI